MLKNNHGQTLVAFVLLIPLISILLLMVIDYGLMSYETRKISNTIKDAIEYGLNNLEKANVTDSMRELITMNIDKDNILNLDIKIENGNIIIDIETKYKSIFFNKIKLSYQGNMIDGKIHITKR
ncbi:MAG: hypothetical protein IJR82_00475 [Bacilli bacterium]|nr:hypothetical protein [Bacilli bacterium]